MVCWNCGGDAIVSVEENQTNTSQTNDSSESVSEVTNLANLKDIQWIVDRSDEERTTLLDTAVYKDDVWYSLLNEYKGRKGVFVYDPKNASKDWKLLTENLKKDYGEDLSLSIEKASFGLHADGSILVAARVEDDLWDLYQLEPKEKKVKILFQKKEIHPNTDRNRLYVMPVRDVVGFISSEQIDDDNTRRRIAVYEMNTGELKNLGEMTQPHSGEDRDRIALFEYGNKNEYYYMNKDYVHQFDFSDNSWKPVVETNWESNYASNYQGELFRSAHHGQIERLERLDKSKKIWQQLFQGFGYSHRLQAWKDQPEAIIGVSGRFGSYVATKNRKYLLPPLSDGLNWDDYKQQINTGINRCQVNGEKQLGCSIRFNKTQEGMTCQLKRIELDLEHLPFISRSISLSTAKYLPLTTGYEVAGLEGEADSFVLILNKSEDENVSKALVLDKSGAVQNETELLNVGHVLDYSIANNETWIASKKGVFKGSLNNLTFEEVFSDEAVKRISAREKGGVAFLSGKTIKILNANGDLTKEITLKDNYVEDLVLSSAHDFVIVVGFNNQKLPSGLPVQSAFMRAYHLTGELVWKRFDFPGQELKGNEADTRLYFVEEDPDGYLLTVGEIAGPNGVFRYDGIKLDGEDSLVKLDMWNETWGSGGAGHLAYTGSFVVESGDLLGGQITSARRASDGKTNSYRIKEAKTSIRKGLLAVSAGSACCIANRAGLEINDQPVGDYAGFEAALMISSPDLKSRYLWTVFSATGEKLDMAIKGLKVTDTDFVVVGQIESGRAYISEGSQKPVDEKAIYFAIGSIQDNFRGK
jgi:hypothetical protein